MAVVMMVQENPNKKIPHAVTEAAFASTTSPRRRASSHAAAEPAPPSMRCCNPHSV